VTGGEEPRGPTLRATGPGKPITGIWSWFAAAPPKGGERQWKDEHSAKELARAWLRADGKPAQPDEVTAVLATHPGTAGYAASEVIPEQVTVLDEVRGEGRNHDLIAVGDVNGVATLLAVEAKAREGFGEDVTERVRRSETSPGSNVPARVVGLLEALTGESLTPDSTGALRPELGALPYQLLTAATGAVIEARIRQCRRAVLLVHAFGPAGTPEDERDTKALDRFVSVLSKGTVTSLAPSSIIGPYALRPAGRVPADVELYVGRVRTPL